MSRNFNRGDVDYDYDMYRNRIRKFVVSGFIGKFKDRTPIWSQVQGFCPEKGLKNLKKNGQRYENVTRRENTVLMV